MTVGAGLAANHGKSQVKTGSKDVKKDENYWKYLK